MIDSINTNLQILSPSRLGGTFHCAAAMSTIDIYSRTRDFALKIEEDGDYGAALTLRSAIDSGSTATEICMALRFHILNMINDGGLMDPLRGEAITLLRYLDNVLK